jgi:hypothetical protein
MPLARREITATDAYGNLLTDVQVEVKREGPLTNEPLFSDRDGLVSISNPFSVDPVTGVGAFHCAAGAFRIRIFKTGFERIIRYVPVGTAAEFDSGTFVLLSGGTMTGILNLFNGSTFLKASGSEGGEFRLEVPASGHSLNGSTINVDIAGNLFRIFEGGSPNRGSTLDITQQANGAGSSILTTANGVAQGKHTIWVPASAMIPRTTNGAALVTIELATNDVMLRTLDFDQTTEEGVQFQIAMPKSWNGGTFTFIPYWTAGSGSGNVVWGLSLLLRNDDDALDTAFGTNVPVTDTLIAANDMHIGGESGAVTPAGSAGDHSTLIGLVRRFPADGSDTLNADAKLLGIKLFYTTNAATDA